MFLLVENNVGLFSRLVHKFQLIDQTLVEGIELRIGFYLDFLWSLIFWVLFKPGKTVLEAGLFFELVYELAWKADFMVQLQNGLRKSVEEIHHENP